MKKCPFCNTEIHDEAVLCIHCNSDLSESDIREIASDAKVCPSCGKECLNEAVICVKCGYSFPKKEAKKLSRKNIEVIIFKAITVLFVVLSIAESLFKVFYSARNFLHSYTITDHIDLVISCVDLIISCVACFLIIFGVFKNKKLVALAFFIRGLYSVGSFIYSVATGTGFDLEPKSFLFLFYTFSNLFMMVIFLSKNKYVRKFRFTPLLLYIVYFATTLLIPEFTEYGAEAIIYTGLWMLLEFGELLLLIKVSKYIVPDKSKEIADA